MRKEGPGDSLGMLETVVRQLVSEDHRVMTESRQQRRARERAEQKARSRPDYSPPPPPSSSPSRPDLPEKVQVYVELEWVPAVEGLFKGYWSGRCEEFTPVDVVDEDDEDVDGWEFDNPISESDDDLAKLVAKVLESIRRQLPGSNVDVNWSNDPGARREAKARAIELPERVELSA